MNPIRRLRRALATRHRPATAPRLPALGARNPDPSRDVAEHLEALAAPLRATDDELATRAACIRRHPSNALLRASGVEFDPELDEVLVTEHGGIVHHHVVVRDHP